VQFTYSSNKLLNCVKTPAFHNCLTPVLYVSHSLPMLLLRFHPQSQEVQSCSWHLCSTCCYFSPAVVWTWETVSIHCRQFKCSESDGAIYSVKRLGKNRHQFSHLSCYNPTIQQQRYVGDAKIMYLPWSALVEKWVKKKGVFKTKWRFSELPLHLARCHCGWRPANIGFTHGLRLPQRCCVFWEMTPHISRL
jgi:hypothetical protein